MKHSLWTHTPPTVPWAPGSTLLIRKEILWFTGFGLHNSAYCCQPWPASPLFYTGMGTSVAVPPRQRLSFAPSDREWLCTWGPLLVMSLLCARIQIVLLKADLWGVTQRHRWQERGEARGWERGWKEGIWPSAVKKKSKNYEGLGHYYTMAALSLTFCTTTPPTHTHTHVWCL